MYNVGVYILQMRCVKCHVAKVELAALDFRHIRESLGVLRQEISTIA